MNSSSSSFSRARAHWEGGRLHIQLSRTKQGYMPVERPPKGGVGRTISIGSAVVDVLRCQSDQQLRDADQWKDAWASDDHVFTQENGEPWHPDRVYDLFCKAVEATGLPPLRVHDLHHTHATLALQAGINPKVVQERLGHKSIKQTMDTYSRVLEVLHESAASRIENLISAPSDAPPSGPPEGQKKRRRRGSEYKWSTNRDMGPE